MDDARLQTVETELLDVVRHGDVGGWEIPGIYLDVLRGGPIEPLAAVVRHNESDVRSLARLARAHRAALRGPAARPDAPRGDLAGLARAYRPRAAAIPRRSTASTTRSAATAPVRDPFGRSRRSRRRRPIPTRAASCPGGRRACGPDFGGRGRLPGVPGGHPRPGRASAGPTSGWPPNAPACCAGSGRLRRGGRGVAGRGGRAAGRSGRSPGSRSRSCASIGSRDLRRCLDATRAALAAVRAVAGAGPAPAAARSRSSPTGAAGYAHASRRAVAAGADLAPRRLSHGRSVAARSPAGSRAGAPGRVAVRHAAADRGPRGPATPPRPRAGGRSPGRSVRRQGAARSGPRPAPRGTRRPAPVGSTRRRAGSGRVAPQPSRTVRRGLHDQPATRALGHHERRAGTEQRAQVVQGRAPASTSSRLMPTRSARRTRRDGPGATRPTGVALAEPRGAGPASPARRRASDGRWSAHASGSSAATGARIQPGARRQPSGDGAPARGDPRRHGRSAAGLPAAPGCRRRGAWASAHGHDLDARRPQEVELRRGGRLRVDADQRAGRHAQPGREQRAVRHAAAQPPAPRIVGRQVAGRRPPRRRRSGSSRRPQGSPGRRLNGGTVRAPRLYSRHAAHGSAAPRHADHALLRAPRGRRRRLLRHPAGARGGGRARGVLRARPGDPAPDHGHVRARYARSRRSPTSWSGITSSSSSPTTG